MRAFDVEWVRQAMKAQRISQAALAEAVGLTAQSAVSAILAGKRRVTVDEAEAIYRVLGRPGSPAQSPGSALAEGLPDYVVVPVIGFAGAGRWREAIELPVGHMPVPARLAGRGAFGIAVSGDSMDQLIDDGGWILVDPAQKELTPAGVYLIANSEGEATVKRYRRDPARFEPCSSNPDHRPFLVSDDDFTVLGKVVWKGAPVL